MSVAFFPALFGNETIKSVLGKDILTGRHAHAYILEGPSYSGRHTAALQIASAVVCENRTASTRLPCGECLACRKIAKGLSPDVYFINSDGKATISVDTIRSIKEELYVPPNDTVCKIYLIEDADKMTVQAQNALLLSLEEPPSFAMFLLLASDSEKLLPTIRSRAPVLRMQIFTAAQVLSYLKEQLCNDVPKVSAEGLKSASLLSGGTIGLAKLYLSEPKELKLSLEKRKLAADLVSQLCGLKTAEAVSLIALLPKKRDELKAILFLALHALRDLLAAKKADSPPLLFYLSEEELPSFIRTVSPGKILSIIDSVLKTIQDIDANVSVQLAVTNLLLT